MPLVTAFNLRAQDPLSEIEAAVRAALVSMPELHINADEIDLVPVCQPARFDGTVARINVDTLGSGATGAPKRRCRSWPRAWLGHFRRRPAASEK